MSTPIQIDAPDEENPVETLLFEYEAIKAIAAGVAEQNAAIQQQNAATLEAVKTLGEQMAQTLTALKELMQGMNIVVNVPEQPAPIVNVQVPEAKDAPAPVITVQIPESPAPIVNVTTPEQRARSVRVKRNKNGLAEGYVIE